MSICTILSIEPLFKATQFDKHQGDYLLKEQPFSNHIYFPNKLCHSSAGPLILIQFNKVLKICVY